MEKKKVISIENRIPKLKEARRKKANRRLTFYLSIFFILILLIVYLQSSLSNIKTIVVKDNELVPNEEIEKYSELHIDQNIWTINKKDTINNLLEHPLIKDAKIERKLPQSVRILVEEYSIIAYVKKKKSYLPIIEDGTVVNYPMNSTKSGPLLNDFKDKTYLKRMAAELRETPDEITELISEVSWVPTKNNKYKIILYMNDGFVVNTSIRDFSNKIKTYPSIVAQLDNHENVVIHMGVGIYVENVK